MKTKSTRTDSRILLYFIIGLTVLAFFLRFYRIPQNLFFGPEQGRDFLVIKNIVLNHDITLIGSKTDIDGVFHGPIFYYLAAIPFTVTGGDPIIISAFFIVLQALTVPLLYLLGKHMFNKRVGIIAATVFCFSYAAISYARWLSNPPLSIPFSVLFFLTFHLYLKKQQRYLLAVAATFGILVQIQFLNLVFFSGILAVLIAVFFDRFRKTSWKILLSAFVILVVISIGNFILFDLRHEFLISKSLLSLTSGKSGYYVPFLTSIMLTTNTLANFFGKTIIPFLSNKWILLTVAVLAVRLVATKKALKDSTSSLLLLLIWLVIPVCMLVLLRHDVLFHFFIPLMIPMLLLVSVAIHRIMDWNRNIGFLFFSVIILTNILFFAEHVPHNRYTFFQENQPEMRLSDQRDIIEQIYKDSNGTPFSFQSYTIPYWSQQAWQYLFWYYGEKQYGFYPLQEKAPLLYVIIQRDPGQFQNDWLKHTVSNWGEEVGSFKKGILTVRKLQIK